MQKSTIIAFIALAVLMVSFQEVECFTGGGIITKRNKVCYGFLYIVLRQNVFSFNAILEASCFSSYLCRTNVASCHVEQNCVMSCHDVVSLHVMSCHFVVLCSVINDFLSSVSISYKIKRSARKFQLHIYFSCRFQIS